MNFWSVLRRLIAGMPTLCEHLPLRAPPYPKFLFLVNSAFLVRGFRFFFLV